MNLFTKRLRDEDRGFTLIELMVVVLIIAILIAIAIPTFLGARKRAQDRAAQSSLRIVLIAAKTIYTDDEHYNNVATNVPLAEPGLTYASPSNGPKAVAMVGSGSVFSAAAQSETQTCWLIWENSQTGATRFGYKTGSCTPEATTAASIPNQSTDKFPSGP